MSEAVAVLVAYAAVAAMPGPNLLLVAHAAVLHGLRGALPQAAGAALGVGLVAALAGLLARAALPAGAGSGALNAASALLLAFAAIRLARPAAEAPAGQAGLGEGFRVAAVNPVTIAYFGAAFAGPLRDGDAHPALLVALMAPAVSFAASLGVATVLAQPPLRRRLMARQRGMRIAVALLLLAAAIRAAMGAGVLTTG